MKAIVEKEIVWKPKFNFFKQSQILFKDPNSDQEHPIEFKFSKIYSNAANYFVTCELGGLGETATGYGDYFLMHHAMRQAFAESWEWLQLKLIGKTRNKIQNSNGFAAGRTLSEAKRKSQEELIERSVFLKAWQDQSGFKLVKPKGIRNWFLLKNIKSKNWDVHFYRIKEKSLGNVLCILSHHEKFGSHIDSTFVGPKISPQHFQKLIRSLSRNITLTFRHEFFSDPNFQLPQKAKPIDQAKFYAQVKNKTAFAFLKNCNDEVIELGHYDQVQTEIIFHGTELLPSVAYSFNSHWPKLSWGLDSIQGKNPWPHPLG